MNRLKVDFGDVKEIGKYMIEFAYGFKDIGYTSTINFNENEIEMFGYNDEYIKIHMEKGELFIESEDISTDDFIKQFNEVKEKYVSKLVTL